MRIALAQINPKVGDLEGNVAKIQEYAERALAGAADLVVFPEQGVTGYPCEDLLFKPHFLDACHEAVDELYHTLGDLPVLIGWPQRSGIGGLYNVATLLDGDDISYYAKAHLPNYGVFDERRYFDAGDESLIISFPKADVGVSICEDIWVPGSTCQDEAACGATIIVNMSASPYHLGKPEVRQQMLSTRARDLTAAIVYVNMVGGQDELVFDGNSGVYDHNGTLIAAARSFQEDLLFCDIDVVAIEAARLRDGRFRALCPTEEPARHTSTYVSSRSRWTNNGTPTSFTSPEAEVAEALTLGIRDYVTKIGFSSVIVGVSGGVDSAVVTALAVKALGADKVLGITMPSDYSSEGTLSDAKLLCEGLDVECSEIPISALMEAYSLSLPETFGAPGVPRENLQARIRGNILMGLSNERGSLVLSCGNKSEMAVGYATLYGDMCGGFSPLKDVPKTMVFKLAKVLGVIQSIIDRPPSAELAPDQKDTDSLPPYDVLDAILAHYIEGSPKSSDYDGDDAPEVIRKVNAAEYKRRQAPPGVKITTTAFGRDRRLPIANGYNH